MAGFDKDAFWLKILSLYNEAKPGAAGRFFNLPPERREMRL